MVYKWKIIRIRYGFLQVVLKLVFNRDSSGLIARTLRSVLFSFTFYWQQQLWVLIAYKLLKGSNPGNKCCKKFSAYVSTSFLCSLNFGCHFNNLYYDENTYYSINFPENCIKMKEIRPKRSHMPMVY